MTCWVLTIGKLIQGWAQINIDGLKKKNFETPTVCWSRAKGSHHNLYCLMSEACLVSGGESIFVLDVTFKIINKSQNSRAKYKCQPLHALVRWIPMRFKSKHQE